MRKLVLVLGLIVLGALAASALPSPVAAQQQGFVAGGILNEKADSRTFVYGELLIVPGLSGGLHYTEDLISLYGWFGLGEGLYGRAEWLTQSTGTPLTVDFGMWRHVRLSDIISLKAWAGLQSEPHASAIWMAANGEVRVRISDTGAIVGGTGITLFKPEPRSFSWVGFGFEF